MLPLRFNRDYELVIGIGGQAVVIRPPLRVQFDYLKSINGGVNKCTLKIYNLSETNRLKLVKDEEQVKYIPIILRVGYNNSLETVFKGSAHKASNEGGVDRPTNIEALDGGFDVLNSFTNRTIKGRDVALSAIIEDMPNTKVGKAKIESNLKRPKVLIGSSSQLIEKMMPEGSSYYIDNEQLFIIKDDEVVSSFVPLVTASTGLLNTPVRQSGIVTFNTLMNPTLKIGGLCELRSKIAPHLNGLYRIDSIQGKGDNDGSDWTQTISARVAGSYKVAR